MAQFIDVFRKEKITPDIISFLNRNEMLQLGLHSQEMMKLRNFCVNYGTKQPTRQVGCALLHIGVIVAWALFLPSPLFSLSPTSLSLCMYVCVLDIRVWSIKVFHSKRNITKSHRRWLFCFKYRQTSFCVGENSIQTNAGV